MGPLIYSDFLSWPLLVFPFREIGGEIKERQGRKERERGISFHYSAAPFEFMRAETHRLLPARLEPNDLHRAGGRGAGKRGLHLKRSGGRSDAVGLLAVVLRVFRAGEQNAFAAEPGARGEAGEHGSVCARRGEFGLGEAGAVGSFQRDDQRSGGALGAARPKGKVVNGAGPHGDAAIVTGVGDARFTAGARKVEREIIGILAVQRLQERHRRFDFGPTALDRRPREEGIHSLAGGGLALGGKLVVFERSILNQLGDAPCQNTRNKVRLTRSLKARRFPLRFSPSSSIG